MITEAEAAYGSRALDNGWSEPIAAAQAVDSDAMRSECGGGGNRPSADCNCRAGTSAIHPAIPDPAARRVIPAITGQGLAGVRCALRALTALDSCGAPVLAVAAPLFEPMPTRRSARPVADQCMCFHCSAPAAQSLPL